MINTGIIDVDEWQKNVRSVNHVADSFQDRKEAWDVVCSIEEGISPKVANIIFRSLFDK